MTDKKPNPLKLVVDNTIFFTEHADVMQCMMDANNVDRAVAQNFLLKCNDILTPKNFKYIFVDSKDVYIRMMLNQLLPEQIRTVNRLVTLIDKITYLNSQSMPTMH